jgi:trehalose 6-phosphate phosphatase
VSAASLPRWHDDWALFLDVDGTLLPIAANPAAVRVPERVVSVLASLQDRLSLAIALVSGRSIAELDRLFAPLRLPAAGVHGGERRDGAGNMHGGGRRDLLAFARRRLAAFCADHPGALLEDKGMALALHYRGAPEIESAARLAVAETLEAAGPDVHLQEGKMVLEIKAHSSAKGDAIDAFMQEPPFRGRRPVFVGDDLTDEHGFDVVNRLGGYSIAVGLGRPTVARWRLRDERQVLEWLESGATRESA